MATSASTADVRPPARVPDDELPRAPASEVASAPEEPEPTTFAFGSDPREHNDNLNKNKRSVPNVRLPVWDGKRRQEPGAYKEWKREITAIQLAYDIQDHRYAPLPFLATKDDARDVLWDLDADNLNSLDMIMTRRNKEFEKLDFEKSELAYQEFERCKRTPGQQMTAYLRDMDRTYTKMIKEDEGAKLSEVTPNVVSPRPLATTTFQRANQEVEDTEVHNHKKNTGLKKFKRYGAKYLDFLPEDAPPDADGDDPEEDDPPAEEELQDPTEGDDQEGENQPEDDEEDDHHDLHDTDYEQLQEILYQGMKAGKKLKSASKGWKKPGRPGRPSSSTASSSNTVKRTTEETGKSLDCGQFGHWKGGPECSRTKSGLTPLSKKHGVNVIHYLLDKDDDDDDDERTSTTRLYDDEVIDWTINSINFVDNSEVMNWDPDVNDNHDNIDVHDANDNHYDRDVNEINITRLTIEDEIDTQYADLELNRHVCPSLLWIRTSAENPNTSEGCGPGRYHPDVDRCTTSRRLYYHEPPVNYPELTQEELGELHQRYEHPMSLEQINMMRQLMIDSVDEEEVFPETVKFHDADEDDEDPWTNIADTVTEKHLIRNDMKMFCPRCEQENHTLVKCQDYVSTRSSRVSVLRPTEPRDT